MCLPPARRQLGSICRQVSWHSLQASMQACISRLGAWPILGYLLATARASRGRLSTLMCFTDSPLRTMLAQTVLVMEYFAAITACATTRRGERRPGRNQAGEAAVLSCGLR